MFVSLISFGLVGIEPYLVKVEVDSRRGLPGFDIVGLPDASVKESRDRVRSAVQNLGYPAPNSKLIANLAPADTRKIGSVYDLAILLGVITACGYEALPFQGTAFLGEIGLGGTLRGVPGALPMVLSARALGLTRVIVPLDNGAEAAVAASEIEVLTATHAGEVIAYLKGEGTLPTAQEIPVEQKAFSQLLDMADVKGQEGAKRALEVSAAGGHNVLLIGPPGTGKSMLAKRLPTILPDMTRQESVETTKVYSVSGLLEQGQSLVSQRPFRSPHHSISPAALVGGGSNPIPGELSLAHNGVLFLDEMPEFPKASLEVLRQPLEDGRVRISRVLHRVEYPSQVVLIGAMNPCPCGYYGARGKECTCTPMAIRRYLDRLSGPILDRMDIQIEVQPVAFNQLARETPSRNSQEIRDKVLGARRIQQERFVGTGIQSNAQISPALLKSFCPLDNAAESILKAAFDTLGLSARGYDRILKVSRTIADLASSELIRQEHVAQAIQFRSLDRKYWNG